MIEDHHARLIHRKKKRSPTSYDWPTASLGLGDTPSPTPTPIDTSNNTPTPTQEQQTSATPTPQTSATPQQQPSATQAATSNTSPTPAPATDTSSSSSTQTPSSDTSSSSTSSSSSSSPDTVTQATATATPTQNAAKVPTVTNTHLVSATQHLSSASASASASAIADATKAGASSNHTGTIIGVVVAVIGGLAAIFFLATFFMRRRARRNEDEFSAEVFKRQSMVLPDDNSHSNPRPPSMIQQHVNQAPVSYGGDQIYGDRSFYGGQNSFAPGEYVSMPPQAWTPDPMTPGSAQPFYQPMGETPIGSPITPVAYDSFYDSQGQLVRQPSVGATAMMNHPYAGGPGVRQPSPGPFAAYNRTPSPGANVMLNRQPSTGPVAALNRQPSLGTNNMMNQSPFGPDAEVDHMESPISPPPAAYVTRQSPAAENFNTGTDAHYVDLNRSSVSPFQAAQYEEISSKLRAPPPQPLPTPEVAAFAEKALANDEPVVPNVSQPLPLNVAVNKSPVQEPVPHVEASVPDDIELPPPSPAYSGKSRVDSTPPTLPEIHLNERSFSPVTMEFPIAPSSVNPSPLSAAFTLPSPPIEAHFPTTPTAANPDTPTVLGARHVRQEPQGKRPDTVYTLYDDDDAYAGI